MVKKNPYALGLTYLSNGNIATWFNKVGGPGFPTKFLWDAPNLQVTNTVVSIANKAITEIVSTLNDLSTVKIEIEAVDETEGYVRFYSGTTLQATVHEKFSESNKALETTFSSPQDSGATLYFELKYLSTTNSIDVKFTFNSINYTGNVSVGSEEIPQCLLDVMSAIATYNPSIEVRAMQYENALPCIWLLIGNGPILPRPLFWNYVLCAFGTGLSGIGGPLLVAFYGAANVAICMAGE